MDENRGLLADRAVSPLEGLIANTFSHEFPVLFAVVALSAHNAPPGRITAWLAPGRYTFDEVHHANDSALGGLHSGGDGRLGDRAGSTGGAGRACAAGGRGAVGCRACGR